MILGVFAFTDLSIAGSEIEGRGIPYMNEDEEIVSYLRILTDVCSDIALPDRKLVVIQYNAKLSYKVDRVE